MIKDYSPGIILTIIIAIISIYTSKLIPGNVIRAAVFALLFGMIVNPLVYKGSTAYKENKYDKGISFISKRILKLAIILLGSTLNFNQVLQVGKYSLFVMSFTLIAAFGGGYYLGKLFGMDWKLSGLISAGTGICGASAIGAIAPTIEAEPRDVAYSISATFIFDVAMIILFPIAGRYFGMSDLGFGLWTGTAVNDTSSVVATGYAFSDAAGSFAIIVKLTRTLSIVPVVLAFSYINERIKLKNQRDNNLEREKVSIRNIFPWFIILFLLAVAMKSIGIISEELAENISLISKFLMVMALGSIGLRTNFREVSKSGYLPMMHGFLISLLVVIVSFGVQRLMGQI